MPQLHNTCANILFCCHTGRVDTLRHTLDLVEGWLEDAEMDPELQDCLMEYAQGRRGLTMEEICHSQGKEFHQLTSEQYEIRWRGCMEGMICRQARSIMASFHYSAGTRVIPECWATVLVQKILEATHGQWLYRIVQLHHEVAGTSAMLQKEAIQWEIEEQLEMEGDGLLDEDQWMMEVNLGDMEHTSGEREQYWLVAIRAAWEAARLQWQRTAARQRSIAMDGH
jgi:hypothetical protein